MSCRSSTGLQFVHMDVKASCVLLSPSEVRGEGMVLVGPQPCRLPDPRLPLVPPAQRPIEKSWVVQGQDHEIA